MGDLAEALVITRGGLTKLVDRLVKAGLLERTFCETDRRVSYATLLPGRRATCSSEMRPVVVAELEVAFAAKLSAAQANDLREALDRVRASACGAELSAGRLIRQVDRIRRQGLGERRGGALFGGLDQRQHLRSPGRSRSSSTGSGSPLTIPSKNSLRSW